MKLISMTDFVLNLDNEDLNEQKIQSIFDYANFLKQPLKLEMFVPCDDDGNVLEEPDSIGVGNDFYYERALGQYEEAKEKVLFEGFEVKKNTVKIAYNSWLEFHFFNFSNGNKEVNIIDFSVEKTEMTRVYKIEDLVKYNLEITNK